MRNTQLNEILLAAWLRISTSINNSRLVSEMSYNESLICNILYQNYLSGNQTPITATDLCQITKMLKSQMNRTLNQLEEKNMITRVRSEHDKRQVHIFLNLEQANSYKKQHQQILSILDRVIGELGHKKAVEAIHLFNDISDIADEIFAKKETKNA